MALDVTGVAAVVDMPTVKSPPTQQGEENGRRELELKDEATGGRGILKIFM